MIKNSIKKIVFGVSSALLVLVLVINLSIGLVLAYFSKHTPAPAEAPVKLKVNELFGQLDSSINPVGKWGTDGNPYLIYNEKHLKNLYLLQNSKDGNAINKDTVFQVSGIFGQPCYVGGVSASELMDLPSIGSEDFPFVSTLRGVTGTGVVLPGGEVSDTSVLGNIRVTAYDGQIDIGLFGVVGNVTDTDATDESSAVGSITNLLLYDVQIAAKAIGAKKEEHIYYNLGSNHETNHIGVLAGHAQNSIIKNISVYYSGTETPSGTADEDGTSKSNVAAFLIASNDNAKYTSSGGIVGYYNNIFVGEAMPVSTESNYDVKSTGGGNTIGSGMGVMYSDGLWESLNEKAPGGLTENSYRIQSSFGYQSPDDLYYDAGSGKAYFTRGVFTFAHSFQLSGYDNITRLWTDTGSKNLTVATNGRYTGRDEILSSAKKFECTRITNLNTEPINTAGSAGYRYMIVYTYGGTNYVLTRNANAVSTQQFVLEKEGGIDYITLAESQINLYSAKVTTPYTVGARTWSAANNNSDATIQGNNNSDTNTNLGLAFYYGPYGNETEADPNGRPLRVFTAETGGLSFVDVTGTAGIPRFYLTTPIGTAQNITYRFKRAQNNYSINYTAAAGFTAAASWGSGVSCALYRIDMAGVIDASDIRKVYEPAAGATTRTYTDMDKRVLFYSGAGYNYNLVTLNSLGWGDENMKKIKQVDTAFVMADPATYYNTSTDTFGLTTVKLAGGETASVPRGTVAFRIKGTGITNDTANINIIVATNPELLVDQTIACAYFPTATGARSEVGSFPLPPAPAAGSTVPIRLTDSEAGYNNIVAYTNFNTVLVAYTFRVPCNYATNTYRTYFLESTLGAASFVYFAVDRTATEKGRNPDHENQLFFPVLNSIDYVYSMALSGVSTIINVTNNSYYVQSLIAPYFGYTRDDATADIIDDFIIVSNYNLLYCIRRTWVQTGTPITIGYGELYITAAGLSAKHIDFTENVFVYTESGATFIAYADHVVMVKSDTAEVKLE